MVLRRLYRMQTPTMTAYIKSSVRWGQETGLFPKDCACSHAVPFHVKMTCLAPLQKGRWFMTTLDPYFFAVFLVLGAPLALAFTAGADGEEREAGALMDLQAKSGQGIGLELARGRWDTT